MTDTFTDPQNSQLQNDQLDEEHEWKQHVPLMPNLPTLHYLRQASAMLDLPVRTTATAIIYYHRFHKFMALYKGKKQPKNGQWVDDCLPLLTNEELLATTCLHLACKATDIPRKVRDLVNVGYRYYHPNESMLQVDETYFRMRSSLVTSELLLVRTLDYNLEVELPFAFCLNTLRGMGSVQFFGQSTTAFRRHSSKNGPVSAPMSAPGWQKEVWRRMEYEMDPELSAVARLSWMFLWDSICSPKLSMTHSVPGIALGCLYLALRTSNADLPMTMSEWVDMWGASENISVQAVRDVVTDLLALYEATSSSSLFQRST